MIPTKTTHPLSRRRKMSPIRLTIRIAIAPMNYLRTKSILQ